MRGTLAKDIALLALAALAGCAHAKTTETVQPKAAEEPPETEQVPRKAPAAPTGEKRKASPTPLATEPLGLLRPGAEQEIREKLSAGGFLKENANGSMQAGIRRFQAEHDLPATGVPDHETVRRLGLNPDELFRKATP
jgi:hypothetical protein